MASFADYKSDYKPAETVVFVLLDLSLAQQHEELDTRLQKIITDSRALLESEAGGDGALSDESTAEQAEAMLSGARDLANMVQALEAKITASRKPFTLRTVGAARWTALQLSCPPSEQELSRGFDYSPRAFFPLALQESCVDPALTAEDAQWCFDKLTVAEQRRLTDGLLKVNAGQDDPLSLAATVILNALGTLSTTVPAGD